VEDLALVQVRKEAEQLLERIHTSVPLFTWPLKRSTPRLGSYRRGDARSRKIGGVRGLDREK
jgi:hypothetical protein